MADQRMTEAEREEFLAGLHVGVLGIERADGPPLLLPVWYSYEPGGDVVVLTTGSSLKGRLVAAAGRASLCAQQEELPYKYVSVEGPVEIDPLGENAHDAVVPMAIRYLGEEMGRGYAANGSASDEIRIRLRPDRWYSVDYGKTPA
ncbi:MAG TPA: TIGR03618 family F420-dependent PPOX class oxidoreductase [Ilumatobacteraceae bacterium]|nr:TIGR03618 family F420-dependent PPOX class oxidoreductase [Ilumatobacteraceae bacterium]